MIPCWRPDSLYPGLCLWPQSHTALCPGVESDSGDATTGCNWQARNHGNRWARHGTSCHPPCVAGWWCHPWKTGDRLVPFPRRSTGPSHKAELEYSESHKHIQTLIIQANHFFTTCIWTNTPLYYCWREKTHFFSSVWPEVTERVKSEYVWSVWRHWKGSGITYDPALPAEFQI